MSVFFTKHAKERMLERGISPKDIKDCINNPNRISMETDHTKRFQKEFSHVTIEVVAELKNNHFVVITVYPL